MGDNNLTDEQANFLAECEEEFKDRYTEKDEDFMKLKSNKSKCPPIVDPWYNKPRRPDWSRQNRGQGRGGRNHNSDRRNNDRVYRNDRHGGKYYSNQRPY